MHEIRVGETFLQVVTKLSLYIGIDYTQETKIIE